MIGGACKRWLLDVQCRGIFEERLLIFRRVLLHAHAGARRIANDLVIDVGDVHYVAYLVSALAQKSAQKVDRNECPKVANVAVIVDRRPARIHANLVIFERPELFHLARECVVKMKRHSESRKAEKNSHSRGMKEGGSNRCKVKNVGVNHHADRSGFLRRRTKRGVEHSELGRSEIWTSDAMYSHRCEWTF